MSETSAPLVDALALAHAKRALVYELQKLKGFVGVGIGNGALRLYVSDPSSPAATHFKSNHGASYRRCPVTVEQSNGFRAIAAPLARWTRFGVPSGLQIGIRWVEDGEPYEWRPRAYGWSMGQLQILVAGINVTATRLGERREPCGHWYLAPFFDWLASNWRTLMLDRSVPWSDRHANAGAAVACNRALDEWASASDAQGEERYDEIEEWYRQHGTRSAAAGGVFTDLFIRRVEDDIELSWSGEPAEFAQDGLAHESGPGHARLPMRDVAETLLQMLEWAVGHPPRSADDRYRNQIAALRAKVVALRDAGLECC